MLKKILTVLIILLLSVTSFPQQKNRNSVKRKYRQTEERNDKLPEVKLYGRVQNLLRERVPGARVYISGTRLEVHTDDQGEYYLKGMRTGRIRIVVSCAGYQTKYIDYVVQEGNNTVYFTLDKTIPSLEPKIATAQFREQQLPDIPVGVEVVKENYPEGFSNHGPTPLTRNLPLVIFSGWSPFKPDISIRGLSGELTNPFAPSRISLFTEEVPSECFNPASTVLYDIERVEIIKGPQSTLSGGGGASGGMIRIFTRKPEAKSGGYITLAAGDYNSREILPVFNLPVVKDLLNMRVAGIYTYRDGYIPNRSGGMLSGRNTMAGRMTVGFMPSWNLRMNLMVSYQQDKMPGTALINAELSDPSDGTGNYPETVSLNGGRDLKNNREILSAILENKWLRNANNFLISRSSFFTGNLNVQYDGDGLPIPALGASDASDMLQFTQELRYNFSKKSRLNGAIGAYYRWFNGKQIIRAVTDERYLAFLMLNIPRKIDPGSGETIPLSVIPDDISFGQLAGKKLPAVSEENNIQSSGIQNAEFFTDISWRLTPRFTLTSGIRGFYQWLSVTNETPDSGAETSVLGELNGNYPRVIFNPSFLNTLKDHQPGISFRVNLKMDLADNTTFFAGYEKGYRSPDIHFSPRGYGQLMEPETSGSYFAGFKSAFRNRLWINLNGYFQKFAQLHTSGWNGFDWIISDKGKATSYGAEAEITAVIHKNLIIFGHYAYTHARFGREDTVGNVWTLSGKEMKITPEHNYSAGFRLNVKISSWSRFFAIPNWSWKSRFWLDDANTPGMQQPSFGLMDATAGFEFPGAGLTVSCTGTNLTDQKYLIYGGFAGMLLPIHQVIPGPQRMISGKVTWRF